jgi:PcfJ-like protein
MRPVGSILSQLANESRAARLKRRTQAFRPRFRRAIAAVATACPAAEDLVDTFPALLFALATGFGCPSARKATLASIGRGGSLREASGTLGLPLWTRRLPPEALGEPLPEFPFDADFNALMVARVPDDARECAVWLDRLTVALKLGGRDLAMWVAREPRLLPPLTSDDDVRWLLAWAWTSLAPTSPGHALLRGAWTPSIGWKRARDEVAIWRKRIELVGALAGGPRDPWFRDGRALGVDIVHIDSVEALIEESSAMENCLDQYAPHLAYGRVRVFSVRRDGKPIADVELTLRSDEATMACIAQIRGPRNRRAPPFVWQAVHAWLGAQPFRPITATPTPPVASREALRTFWRAYADALTKLGLDDRLAPPMAVREGRRLQLRQPGPRRQALNLLAPSDAPAHSVPDAPVRERV